MDDKEEASTFCHYTVGPAILDKSNVLPIVDKSHRRRLQIKTLWSSKEDSRPFYIPRFLEKKSQKFAYLTNSGRFLILLQLRESMKMRDLSKVIVVERCSPSSTGDVYQIFEKKLDIQPHSICVSPNEKFMIIYGLAEKHPRNVVTVNLYELTLSSNKRKLKKVDSVEVSIDFFHRYSFTDTELITYGDESSIKFDIGKKFSPEQRCDKSVLEHLGILCGSIRIATLESGLYVLLTNSHIRKGKKLTKKIIDKDWREKEGGKKDIRATQIYPQNAQKSGIEFYVITSFGGSIEQWKIYLIQIQGNSLKNVKTLRLLDLAEDIFGVDFVDIGLDSTNKDKAKFGDISFNPYTGDCYVLFLHDFPVGDNDHPYIHWYDGPLICRQRIFGFNIFSPEHKHILEVSDVASVGSRMFVNWSSNEVLLVDTDRVVLGYQIPLKNLSLQVLAKREVLKLYKPEEILQFDIPRYLREYILS